MVGELYALVQRTIEQRAVYQAAAEKFGTPQYLIEADLLRHQVARFQAAFAATKQTVRTYYAFKANPTLPILKLVRASGLLADVSSGLELSAALALDFEQIVFSGPGKTDDELTLAIAHADRVVIHVDSFAEVIRLNELASRAGIVMRAGIRLNTAAHGLWTKFGIPLKDLAQFIQLVHGLDHVRLEGVQFHLSWNRQSAGYVETLKKLGPILAAHRPKSGWRFVDIGGGFYPEDDEAAYPWVVNGQIAPAEGPPPDWDMTYDLPKVAPIESMAEDVVATFRDVIRDVPELWVEPGRYIANPAVHVMLRVVDVKGDAVAITDGGTNLLGWERLELEHTPLINLTRPSAKQIRFMVYGSLCTPHDVWGYTCYAEDIRPDDLLITPAQGSYVQTLAQRFIKPVCQTILLETNGSTSRVANAETARDRYPELFPTPVG
jgi:diaminopimelate decarboxylase